MPPGASCPSGGARRRLKAGCVETTAEERRRGWGVSVPAATGPRRPRVCAHRPRASSAWVPGVQLPTSGSWGPAGAAPGLANQDLNFTAFCFTRVSVVLVLKSAAPRTHSYVKRPPAPSSQRPGLGRSSRHLPAALCSPKPERQATEEDPLPSLAPLPGSGQQGKAAVRHTPCVPAASRLRGKQPQRPRVSGAQSAVTLASLTVSRARPSHLATEINRAGGGASTPLS